MLLIGLLTPAATQAQCTVNITPSVDTLCLGDSTVLTAEVPSGGSLLTTMAAGNNHRGNMFDITAINTLTITQFDGSPMATTNIAVYYRPGTHVGFEMSSTGWTLLGTANNVVPIGSPTPTPFPIPINVTIPAGQTYAFYVTSTNVAVSLNYSNGTAVGNVLVSDANMQFKEGKGMEYPFCNGSSPFSPRNWNGRIHYTIPGTATYAWSTGATSNSITVTPSATTTYSVTATSSGTCTATSTVKVGAVNVDLGADTSYCGAGSVTLDAGAGIANYLWNTGATTQTVTGAPGLNWVEATDTLGCADRDSILITQNPGLTVALGPDTLICGVGPYLLDAGNPGSNHAWNTGASTQTLTVSASGTYGVLVTDSLGCTGTDSVTVNISNAAIDIGNDTTLCNAASTILTVGGGWASVLWSNGSTNDFINVNATNTYSVAVVDSFGCTDADTILVTASSNPIASFGVNGTSNCTVASVTNSSQQGVTFLWVWGDGNTSTGANPGPHTYASPYNGNIMLVVTNPCGVDTLEIPFGCVGTVTPTTADISLAPNPSDGHVQLSIAGLDAQTVDLTVINLQGQQVHAAQLDMQGTALQTALDLSHLAKGVYFLRIATEVGQDVRRIVIE